MTLTFPRAARAEARPLVSRFSTRFRSSLRRTAEEWNCVPTGPVVRTGGSTTCAEIATDPTTPGRPRLAPERAIGVGVVAMFRELKSCAEPVTRSRTFRVALARLPSLVLAWIRSPSRIGAVSGPTEAASVLSAVALAVSPSAAAAVATAVTTWASVASVASAWAGVTPSSAPSASASRPPLIDAAARPFVVGRRQAQVGPDQAPQHRVEATLASRGPAKTLASRVVALTLRSTVVVPAAPRV